MIWKSVKYKFGFWIFLFVVVSIKPVEAQQKQPESLQVIEFELKNGLKVYLNRDMNSPNLTGMIAVRTGSKYDSADATGIAHYLEHMLFKGTDQLGTVDFESESIYLDSIRILYDSLGNTVDEPERKHIQNQINDLSLKAGEYAIPNELDLILNEIGSKGVNAFTGYDMNAYFNRFPPHQLEKWLKIYSHRFKNPVFRLFQSELETVFEEKNMYMDQFEMSLIEAFYGQFYRNHPYGQQTILGNAEHIRNPSLTEMQKFYDTYYVANNMALILSGPLEIDDAKALINAEFNDFASGTLPEFETPKEQAFHGIETHTERLTPIRAGLIGFRTAPITHPDRATIDVIHALLSNENETGLLDRLGQNTRMMYSMAFNDMRQDAGAAVFLYVPRIVFHSMRNAEQMVLDEIEKIKTGAIDDEFLAAVKQSLVKQELMAMEKGEDRVMLLLDCFIFDQSWEEKIRYAEKLNNVSKADLITISRKYYGDNYLLFRSRMGFPKTQRLKKPGFDPVSPKYPNVKSVFSRKLEQVKSPEIQPDYLEFGKDVIEREISQGMQLYYVENPVNSVFQLDLKFKRSIFESSYLNPLAFYLNQCGTTQYPENEFQQKLQALASTVSVSAGDQYFSIQMTGMDEYLDSSLVYLNQLLQSPAASKQSLKRLTQMKMVEKRYEKRKPDIKARALADFVIFGDESRFLSRASMKDLRRLSSENMIAELSAVLSAPCEIHYSGQIPEKKLSTKLLERLKLPNVTNDIALYQREIQNYEKPSIYFLNDKKAIQSQIYFYIPGKTVQGHERAIVNAYNRYFGVGMTSVVFQEVRELRSMAYSAWANYFTGFYPKNQSYFKAFVGTQSDKTVDAIRLMDSLIYQFPIKSDRILNLKQALKQSIVSETPDFRNISYLAAEWRNQGYQTDPRKMYYQVYDELEQAQLELFHKMHISENPMQIIIVGDKRKIDLDALRQFGDVFEINENEILN
ncbi:MAG: insulinase family protein [Bacteroidota bacterium]|nr:insulinase family protein [Bacteroidota bacterium]